MGHGLTRTSHQGYLGSPNDKKVSAQALCPLKYPARYPQIVAPE